MRLVLTLAALAISAVGEAASLFDENSLVDIALEGPLSTVMRDVEERRERAFLLHIDGVALDVEVRVRGNSRLVHCRFPPLRLDFPAEQPAQTVFSGQDKLKLVTHCRDNAHFEQNVLEEYAAYRIMNLLSEMSFRVRPLRIRYVDTESPGADTGAHFGFVVESDEELAGRHAGEILDVPHVTRSMLDETQSALVYVFQYLIGNTDWSHVRFPGDDHCCHNGRLVSAGGRTYYVPYDFDLSGLVDARYAKPQPELRLRSVRVRRYRGYCTDRRYLENALRRVISERDRILVLFQGLPGLEDKSRKSGSDYLQRFFERAADEEKLLREFERRCL